MQLRLNRLGRNPEGKVSSPISNYPLGVLFAWQIRASAHAMFDKPATLPARKVSSEQLKIGLSARHRIAERRITELRGRRIDA